MQYYPWVMVYFRRCIGKEETNNNPYLRSIDPSKIHLENFCFAEVIFFMSIRFLAGREKVVFEF